MRNMIYVTMVGTAPRGQGGVSSVVTQFLNHNWGETVSLTHINTHVSGNVFKRIHVFLSAYGKLLYEMLFERNTDIIHMHMSGNGSFYRKYLLHRMIKKFGMKDVIHLHASHFQTFYQNANTCVKKRIRRMLRECDRILVLGTYWKRVIIEIEPDAKVEILRNAVKIPKETSSWNETTYRLLYLGTLIERKGIPDLLEAMQILNCNHPALASRLQLLIAGSGPEEKALRIMVERMKLTSQVQFVGWIDGAQKSCLIQSVQCMVLPSYDEGLPVAILEILSYGIPVVSTDVGSIAEAVVDGQNGFLVPVHDPERIATAITEIFKSRMQWVSFSENARNLAKQYYDEEKMFAELERIYQELMNEGEG